MQELKEFLIEFFASSELNRLHENYGGGRIFSDPLIGVAGGDDYIYQKYKEVVGPEHFTPLEFWLAEEQKTRPASKLRIISIAFPFVDKIRVRLGCVWVFPHFGFSLQLGEGGAVEPLPAVEATKPLLTDYAVHAFVFTAERAASESDTEAPPGAP